MMNAETNTAATGMGDLIDRLNFEAAALIATKGRVPESSDVSLLREAAAALAAQPAPVGNAVVSALKSAYDSGWHECARMAKRDDLHCDIDSPFVDGKRQAAVESAIAGNYEQPAPVVGGDAEPWGYADPKSGRSIHRNLITSTVKVGALGEVGELVDASTIYTVPLYTHPALLAARPGGEGDELKAYEAWFLGEQGKAYDGMKAFARAAWLARAVHPAQAGGGRE